MNDEERPRPKPVLFTAPNLENVSVAEGQAYIDVLREEIARVEKDIAKKKASKEAADSFFKK